jgi:hypothetical protein
VRRTTGRDQNLSADYADFRRFFPIRIGGNLRINPQQVRGARKPMKRGGYRDSGADIAFILRPARRMA